MATVSQPHGKVLDYEQYIDHQLRQTRARIKTTDLLTGSVTLAAAVLGVLFLEVVLDHAFGLPRLVRQVILLAGLAGGGAYAVRRIALPMLRSVNGLYAARTIEEADPAFKNSLISYLDLRRHRAGVPPAILAAIEAKAVNDLTRVEIDAVVNQRRLTQMFYALAAVAALSSLYMLMTPRSIVDSVKRALLAEVARPTNTRLEGIKPGDDPEQSKVVAGVNVNFSTETRGARPGRVVLHYSIDGGKYFSSADLAPGKYRTDPWKFTLPNVQQDIDYYLTGGDAESRRYRVRVLPAPMVTAVSVDLDFPAYTGVPRRAGVEGGNVEAIEGTMVTVHARTNLPAASGQVDFDAKSKIPSLSLDASSSEPTTLTGRFRVGP